MRTIALIFCSFAMVAGTACGQAESQADSPAPSLTELDTRVPRLPVGASESSVVERLGQPRSRTELADGEVSVFYGPWHLVFHPGLIARLRYYKAGHWPRSRPFGPLDRKVHRLQLRFSREAVESELGKTETWEVRVPRKSEFLWYGNGRWRLKFVHSRLVDKDYTEQVTSLP